MARQTLDLEELVELQADEVSTTLAELAAIPALGKTGDGYPETAALLARKLSATGLAVEELEVPTDYLLGRWGSKFEKTAEYIAVSRLVPRTIVFGRHAGTRAGAPSLHLTQHYDLPARLATELATGGIRVGDGRVAAPGVSFCRAGIVSMLAAARALANLELGGDLFVSFTPDNHLGGETGAGYLVEQGFGKSDLVITGSEGGPATIGLGYKGALWLKITTRGRTATAALPHLGVNAIDKMATIQGALRDLEVRLGARTTRWPIMPPEAARPTLVVSQIVSSGWGVPDKCVIFVDRRILPEETVASATEEIEAVIRDLQALDGDLVVDVETVHAVEPAGSDPDGSLAASLRRSVRQVLGVEPQDALFTYYTEFRLFPHAWGAQVINYSPGRVERVDGEPEHVMVSDVLAAAKVLALTARDMLAT